MNLNYLENACLTSFKNQDWLDLASELILISDIYIIKLGIDFETCNMGNCNINLINKNKLKYRLNKFTKYHITFIKSKYKNFNSFDDYMIVNNFDNSLTYKQYLNFKNVVNSFDFCLLKYYTKIFNMSPISKVNMPVTEFKYTYYQPLTLKSCCYKIFCDYLIKINKLPKYEQHIITYHRNLNNKYICKLASSTPITDYNYIHSKIYKTLQDIEEDQNLILNNRLSYERSKIRSYQN